MTDKFNLWTEEDDRMLKFIFQTTKLTKWSQIAKKLQQYGVKGRTGKQCKERYINYINPNHPKQDWTYEDEQLLIQLHESLGNKWAIIGTKMGGRTDNEIKNHFYSRLRKSLRRLNLIIHQFFKKEIKQLKPTILYKITEINEQKFKNAIQIESELIQLAVQLKNQLWKYSYNDEEFDEKEVERGKRIIHRISQLLTLCKNNQKNINKNNLFIPSFPKPRKYSSENLESDESAYGHSSEASNLESDDEIKRNYLEKMEKSSNLLKKIDRVKSEGVVRNQQNKMVPENEEGSQNNPIQIDGILQGMKILEQQNQDNQLHQLPLIKFQSKQSFQSDKSNEKQQYHFFEDSQIEMRILPEIETDKIEFHEDNFYN